MRPNVAMVTRESSPTKLHEWEVSSMKAVDEVTKTALYPFIGRNYSCSDFIFEKQRKISYTNFLSNFLGKWTEFHFFFLKGSRFLFLCCY